MAVLGFVTLVLYSVQVALWAPDVYASTKCGFLKSQCDKYCRKNCGFVLSFNMDCVKDWYGNACVRQCRDGCSDGGCTPDGKCSCKSGYYGSNCTRCPQTCRERGCNIRNGECMFACKMSWYGKRCDRQCPQNCNKKTCDFSKGTCTEGCHNSWYGNKCDQKCPPNCVGGHCKDGMCDGCEPGYSGSTCNVSCPQYCDKCQHDGKCIVCQKGKYGSLCNHTCNNCNDNLCDMNGSCKNKCLINFYGRKCERVCSKTCGKLKNVDKVCAHSSGECWHGCVNGWFGERCEMQCIDCKTCDRGNGTCLSCFDGRHGKTCDKDCNRGCRGGICDQTTGTCTEGCSNTSYGIYCNHSCSNTCSQSECHVDSSESLTCTNDCVDGWWGPFCQHQCSGNCRTCDMDSGVCDQCKRHIYGYKCSQTCSDGCVGQDCDMMGICRHGCAHGWIGERCLMSTMWLILPGCVTVATVCIAVLFYLRKFKHRQNKEYDGNIVGTDDEVALQLRDNELTTNFPGRHQADISDLPLLRAETFVNPTAVMTRVSLDHLRGYVQNEIRAGGLLKQFDRLPVNPVYPCHEGTLSRSETKNRYGNILPYDYNRVILAHHSKSISSDYINASYIKGYATGSFIATQGPYSEVLGEFWTMIWQENVRKIVMLTNCIEDSMKKCEQYWPNVGKAYMITPDTTLDCFDEIIDESFTIRCISLAKEGCESREIRQFHFTTWPDRGVPDNVTSLLKLHTAVTFTPSIIGPVVVHCSAGVGRTGTYIALDYLINQAKTEGVVDVFDCVLRLRHQRMNLVQTREQYLLIHDILLQVIETQKGNTWITPSTVSGQKEETV